MGLPQLAAGISAPDNSASDNAMPAMFSLTSARGGAAIGAEGVGARLAAIHRELRDQPGLGGIVRIAIALYDEKTGRLSTFVNSHDQVDPVGRVSMRLSAIPALAAVAAAGEILIDDDISRSDGQNVSIGPQNITRRLAESGIRARCAVPLYRNDELLGFLFLNARWAGYFTPTVLRGLRPYWQLIATMVAAELDRVRALSVVAMSADRLAWSARPGPAQGESAGHLARVAEYTDLILRDERWHHAFDDETASYIRFYAPLHDIGKLAIPTNILCKPGELTADERTIMKSHVACGVAIVEAMRHDLGAAGLPHFDLLRNIVAFHHETLDGSGYPAGASGDAVPHEGRIVAVADVFDALTSRRPYKAPWTNERAFTFLNDRAGTAFDAECVAAFLRHEARIVEIQDRIRDSA